MQTETTTIDGPERLEGRWDVPDQATGVAVLAHPHPQYGGSMFDGVLDVAAQVLIERGVACLRFNFRGVGASTGHHDGGEGEVADVLAACTAARERLPNLPLMLCGYSFGAAMAIRATPRLEALDTLLLIAPPTVMRLPAPPADVRIVAVAGDRDDFAPVGQLEAWAEGVSNLCLSLVDGADHFFSGRAPALAATIAQAL